MHSTIRAVAQSVCVVVLFLGQPGLALSQAPEQTIFGPKSYDHPTFRTSRSVDSVQVPAFVGAPFTLHLENGDGRARVHEAFVFLNGRRVFDPDDFRGKARELERTVRLQPQDRLVVVIRGRPRTHFILSISGRRIPPAVAGLAPDPIRIVAGASGSLIATLSPPPGAAGEVSVASADTGVATVPASVPFAAEQTQVTIPVAGLAEGRSTAVTATLNGSSASAQVNVVPPPPQITGISPAFGSVGTLVTLTGVFFDPVPANNQVSFLGANDVAVPAAVIAANASTIAVKVPPAAIFGPVTLVNSRGAAQSAPFTLMPQAALFGATRAGITARTAISSSPVTPFVQGADPGEAFSFLVLAPPASGTGSIVGNKLVYLSNPGFSGLDQFPYRVVTGDGSSLDGTAHARVYGANGLSRCTAASTLVAGVFTRITAGPCSFYGESVTRTTAAGDAVTVKYIALRPSNGAAPKAAVFLIGGADLDMGITGDPVTGAIVTTGGNFLVRAAQLFAEAGYLAVAMDRPSDQPPAGSTDTTADADQYRISVNHAVDILASLQQVNTDGLDVFLAGTSRGAISVVANNMISAGISLSSAVTRASSGDPALLFVNDPRHPNLQPGFVQRPVHVLWNTSDQCPLTRPADAQTLFNNLQATGTPAAFNAVSGGFATDPDPCNALAFHGYLGIEPAAVATITSWLDARVSALAGDKRPDAAFAALADASSAPLAIDLASLTRDGDGDLLSYALSHATTSLGGSVVLDGTTVTYTPPAGATNATDYFVYVVTDGKGGVNAAVVSIRIGG